MMTIAHVVDNQRRHKMQTIIFMGVVASLLVSLILAIKLHDFEDEMEKMIKPLETKKENQEMEIQKLKELHKEIEISIRRMVILADSLKELGYDDRVKG